MRYLYKTCLFSALLLAVFSASAVPITGTMQYVGITAPTGGTDLSDATGLAFPDSVGNEGTILIKDGMLATLITDNVIDLNDFSFNPLLPGGATLWLDTESGVSFKLNSVVVSTQTDSFLNLKGSGVLSAPTFDDSNATWELTTQSVANNLGATITFSASSSSIEEVPEPALLGLLGLGLLGIGSVRKLKRS